MQHGNLKATKALVPLIELLVLLGSVLMVDAWIPGLGGTPLLGGFAYFFIPLLGAFFLPLIHLCILVFITITALYLGLPILTSASFLVDSAKIFQETWFFAACFFPLSLAFGIRLDSSHLRIRTLGTMLRKLGHENWRLEKVNKSLQKVQTELELRVGKQGDSLILLHNQLKKLERNDLGGGLKVFLETLAIFTHCSQASVWIINREQQSLSLEADLTLPPEEKPARILPLDASPQGWAVQNNRIYSIRLLREYPQMLEVDDHKTIMAIPLGANGHPWAVLSIGAMPFEKYNPYTERLVQIICRLMEGELNRILAYERAFALQERDNVTGIPLFGMLVRSLEEILVRSRHGGHPFSLVLVEGRGLGPDTNILDFLPYMNEDFPEGSKVFHFKADSQLALLVPNLDAKACALMCLHLLTRSSTEHWPGEVIFGYCSWQTDRDFELEEIIRQAEHLLEIQKL